MDGDVKGEQDEEGAVSDLHAALPDEEFPAAAYPAMRFCADNLTSGEMDEIRAIRKVHTELQQLREAVADALQEDAEAGRPKKGLVRSLQKATRALLRPGFSERVARASEDVDVTENDHKDLPCDR